jgi:predicted kinase
MYGAAEAPELKSVSEYSPMLDVLILTGTCGSGKSTIAGMIAGRGGWVRISEDAIWKQMFHKNRGVFGSDEHRSKRRAVHEVLFAETLSHLNSGNKVVIDATVHEAPPESYDEYRAFFREKRIVWALRVLHPRLEVAIARDRLRTGWHAGEERVRDLRAKFTSQIFPPECFVDTSGQSPDETVMALLFDIDRALPVDYMHSVPGT